jgi:hypothetical protein
MPPIINPDQVSFPHFSPEPINRDFLAYFHRHSEHDYPHKRFRAELDWYNELRSQAHSADYQIFELDQKKSTLQVNQQRIGVVTRGSVDDEGFAAGRVSLFRKPGDRAMIEITGPNRAEQARTAAELEIVTSSLKRLRDKRSDLHRRARPLHLRLEAMKKLIRSNMTSGRPMKVVPLPSITKAPSLDRLHASVATLRAELAAVEAAPLPAAVAKERARAWVEGLSRPPYAHNALDRDGIIDLPHVATGDSFSPDVLGFIAWLAKDQLIAKLGEMIDAAAGSDGLDDTQRAARLRDTRAKLSTNERLIEAVIWARLQAGEPVDLLTDLSPDSSAAAILSVEGE